MAIRRPIASCMTLYLILSGHCLVSAMRTAQLAGMNSTFGEESYSKSTVDGTEGTIWCNPFSSLSLKYYRIEQVLSGENCQVGECNAYEMVRDAKDPILRVFHGQSWAAKFVDEEESDQLTWDIVHLNPKATASDEDLHIKESQYLMFGEANEELGLPDYIRMKFSKREGDGKTDVYIKGGLYFQDDLVARGIKKMQAQHEEELAREEQQRANAALSTGSEGVRKDGIVTHGRSKGWKWGLGLGLVSVGGFWAAATMTGVAISNTALISAALAAAIGGAIAGAVLGAGIGAIVGIAGIVGVIKLIRNKGFSGAGKVWDKMKCIPGFTVCATRRKLDGQRVTVMVPSDKKCPTIRFDR